MQDLTIYAILIAGRDILRVTRGYKKGVMNMMKRGLAFLVAGIMLLASPVSVLADREDAKLEKTICIVRRGSECTGACHCAGAFGGDRG